MRGSQGKRIAAARSSRPQRRAEIVSTAAALMRQRGFDGVALKDVATGLGVTAPALYRDFPSKQALLAAAISDGLDAVEAAVASVVEGRLDSIVASLADAAVDHVDLWRLLHRESRHLDAEARTVIDRRFGALIEVVGAAIVGWRDVPVPAHATMLAHGILAALSAPSQYRQRMPRRALANELAAAATRVADAELSGLPTRDGPRVRFGPPFDPDLGRHEAILAAAAQLFAQRGYRAVTMEDIGAAVSIAGPSIYNHFSGKPEILADVMRRSLDLISADLTRAVHGGGDAESALLQMYSDYADLAVHHREIFDVFTVEAVNLPDRERDRIGRAHDAFIDRWSALLQRARPVSTAGVARVRVTASLAVINELGPPIRAGSSPGTAHGTLVAMAVAAAIPRLEFS